MVDSIEIVFGIALLLTAVYVRRHRSEIASRGPSPRTAAIRTRLANLRPLTALGTGAVLGIGGPKRIGVTIVVSAAIAAAGLESAEALALAVLYVAVATVLVWVPVLLYLAFGSRATEWLERRTGLDRTTQGAAHVLSVGGTRHGPRARRHRAPCPVALIGARTFDSRSQYLPA